MRTNVTLEDDIHEQIAAYASARNLTLGRAIGEIVRKCASSPPPQSRLVEGPRGLKVMPSRGTGRLITQETVDQARSEGYFG